MKNVKSVCLPQEKSTIVLFFTLQNIINRLKSESQKQITISFVKIDAGKINACLGTSGKGGKRKRSECRPDSFSRGSNVNPYFVNEFKKMYGNNCISYKSKEAVALGDAVYAYMLEKGIMKGLIYSENQSGSHSKIPKMKQVSNETLGLRILDGSGAGTKVITSKT